MDDFFKNQLLLLKQDEGINEKRCDLRMEFHDY